jgi:hypothetical protein
LSGSTTPTTRSDHLSPPFFSIHLLFRPTTFARSTRRPSSVPLISNRQRIHSVSFNIDDSPVRVIDFAHCESRDFDRHQIVPIHHIFGPAWSNTNQKENPQLWIRQASIPVDLIRGPLP